MMVLFQFSQYNKIYKLKYSLLNIPFQPIFAVPNNNLLSKSQTQKYTTLTDLNLIMAPFLNILIQSKLAINIQPNYSRVQTSNP